ncbi:retrovirus-related pol polyprotein from transposon TNT 1-94 [Tanacetum coccineum]
MLGKGTDFSEESVEKSWGKELANESGSKFILGSVLVLPSNWFPLTRVKWLPLMANSFAVSGIVIAEPGVRARTRQFSGVEVMELFCFIDEVFDLEYVQVQYDILPRSWFFDLECSKDMGVLCLERKIEVFHSKSMDQKPTGYKKNDRISDHQDNFSKVVLIEKPLHYSVETQKPELASLYKQETKNVKIVDIPSSSSLVMTRCPDCSLVSGLRMFKTHDRESLLAHELSSKTKSWLCHCRLSHLNFGTINKLTKDGLARGLPRLKFQKDHLCSACALGKSKRSSHQSKAEDTNQEKLYLLYMDLGGPMRMASINRKRYILVIVDDYSRLSGSEF